MKKQNCICGLIFFCIIIFGNCTSKKIDSKKWETIKSSRQNISASVLATGIIKPKVGAEVRVGSRISGIVKKLHVNIGDKVIKEQLLAEIDPVEFQAQFNQARSELELIEANLEYARADLKRQESLYSQNAVSKEILDVARKNYRVNEAQLHQAEANLEYAQIQLEYTKIKAPINGSVASVSTQEGETVTASFTSPTFVTIIDLDRLEVWAYVDETDIGRIQVGQKVMFTVDTYLDTEFNGKVTAIYPKAEIKDNVVNYVVIIEVTNDKGKILRPEMTTTIKIHLALRENVLSLPNKAIRRDGTSRYVYILEDNHPQKRMVKVGLKDKYYSEIIEGLEMNDKIVMNNIK
jgi:macrolide-specific efflux system membrane fusion protein